MGQDVLIGFVIVGLSCAFMGSLITTLIFWCLT